MPPIPPERRVVRVVRVLVMGAACVVVRGAWARRRPNILIDCGLVWRFGGLEVWRLVWFWFVVGL